MKMFKILHTVPLRIRFYNSIYLSPCFKPGKDCNLRRSLALLAYFLSIVLSYEDELGAEVRCRVGSVVKRLSSGDGARMNRGLWKLEKGISSERTSRLLYHCLL